MCIVVVVIMEPRPATAVNISLEWTTYMELLVKNEVLRGREGNIWVGFM